MYKMFIFLDVYKFTSVFLSCQPAAGILLVCSTCTRARAAQVVKLSSLCVAGEGSTPWHRGRPVQETIRHHDNLTHGVCTFCTNTPIISWIFVLSSFPSITAFIHQLISDTRGRKSLSAHSNNASDWQTVTLSVSSVKVSCCRSCSLHIVFFFDDCNVGKKKEDLTHINAADVSFWMFYHLYKAQTVAAALDLKVHGDFDAKTFWKWKKKRS